MPRLVLLVAVGLLLTRSAMADGTIVSWGDNRWGQVSDTPTGTGFTAIAMGEDHCLALGSESSIVNWVRNEKNGKGQRADRRSR